MTQAVSGSVTTFALKSLLGRKVRTALTAIAIVLGVAMISGTYVLTDSISNAFDAIFTQSYRGTDAVDQRQVGLRPLEQRQHDGTALRRVAAAEGGGAAGGAAAVGGVGGEAHLIGKNGKAIVFGGAPNLGFSVDPDATRASTRSRSSTGDWPKAGRGRDRRVDRAARRTSRSDSTIGVQAQGPVERCGSPASSSSAASRTIGGATLAGFDLPTAQRLFDKAGKLDQIRAAAKAGVSPESSPREIQRDPAAAARRCRAATAQATSDAKDTNSFISFLQTFLLAFARRSRSSSAPS